MQPLRPNVFYDGASTHKWDDLNETVFLERFMDELELALGSAFADYTFYIQSTRDGRAIPESAMETAPRKVLFVISDESGSVPSALQPHYAAIFKCYLRHELPGTNIYPFNLGYVREVEALPVTPIDERPVSVFFSGNLSATRLPLYRAVHPVYRHLPAEATRAAFRLSRRHAGTRLLPSDLSRAFAGAVLQFNDGFKTGLTPGEYARVLADSRIALCPMGASSGETFRHIEAMRAGTVVVSAPLPQTHFYRGAPVVTGPDWPSRLTRVRELLADSAALQQTQTATLRWWQEVCSEAATARFVAARLREAA